MTNMTAISLYRETTVIPVTAVTEITCEDMWHYRAVKSATVTSIDFVLPSGSTKIGGILPKVVSPPYPRNYKQQSTQKGLII